MPWSRIATTHSIAWLSDQIPGRPTGDGVGDTQTIRTPRRVRPLIVARRAGVYADGTDTV